MNLPIILIQIRTTETIALPYIMRINHLFLTFFIFYPILAFGQLTAITKAKVEEGLYYIEFAENNSVNKTFSDPIQLVSETLGNFLIEVPQSFITEQIQAKLLQTKGLFKTKNIEPFERTKRFMKIRVREGYTLQKKLLELERKAEIKSIEPAYTAELAYTPNDPYFGTNNTLRIALESTMKFFQAWDVEKADTSIVIAILDSGVDYNHPDLRDKLWYNLRELAGESGVDDDGNGYVDDTKGWDFWSAGDVFDRTMDNDPLIDLEDHGTHVAGSATATPDNGEGIAGTGFNARFMAVKMGGSPLGRRSIAAIPEGLIYAGMNGADVINCSFAGGGGNAVVQAIINDLSDLGVVVVAAAGNDGTTSIGYPAAYDNVLSVGSARSNTTMSSFSNYGYNLDVVAVGEGIYSTSFRPGYSFKSGTSMASPMVAGLAGLVKAAHPDWSAPQIIAQIRSSAYDIYANNTSPLYRNRLGGGMIDAAAAVGTPLPGLRVSSYTFESENGSKLRLLQPGRLNITLVNDGAASEGLSISITQPGEYWNLSSVEPITGLGMNHGDSLKLSFSITLNDNFPFQTLIPQLSINIEDASSPYDDVYVLEYDKLLYDEHQENEIVMTYGANGTLGFLEPFEQTGARGFIPRLPIDQEWEEFDNQLFEGGMMLTIGNTVISSVRGSAQPLRRDFFPEELIQLEYSTVSGEQTAEGRSRFRVKDELGEPVQVDLRTFASSQAELSKALVYEYTLTNTGQDTLEDIRLGLFNDWDLPEYSENSIIWSSDDSLQVVRTLGANKPYIAVVHLGNVGSAFAINNGYEGAQDSLRFSVYDGYDDQEKIWSMRSGTAYPEIQANTADVSVVSASGPWTLGPQKKVTTAFAYVWGQSIQEVQQQAAAVRAAGITNVSPPGVYTSVEEFDQQALPIQTQLLPSYPNPFNPSTTIRYILGEASSSLQIDVFNIQGQKVATLMNSRQSAGSFELQWNASALPSGIYFVRMQTNGKIFIQKVSLLK